MNRILKIAAIVLSLLLAGSLTFSIWQEKQTEKGNKEKSVALEKELRPLEVERNRLRQELDTLKTEHKNRSKGAGSVVLLFTDLSENIYTEIFPQMKESGFAGMMAVSPGQIPGKSGCLSREQFKELIDAGWTYCLRWEEDLEPEGWLEACRAAMQELEIDEPGAVYFPADTYSSDMGRFLKKENFSIAVHHGEEEMPVVTADVTSGMWYPGAAAWNQQKASKALAEAISQGGGLVFTVGSDTESEQYEAETFSGMLRSLWEHCKKDELVVTDLMSAREYYEGLKNEQKDLRIEYQKTEADLEEQIEELGRDIDAVTGKYIK